MLHCLSRFLYCELWNTVKCLYSYCAVRSMPVSLTNYVSQKVPWPTNMVTLNYTSQNPQALYHSQLTQKSPVTHSSIKQTYKHSRNAMCSITWPHQAIYMMCWYYGFLDLDFFASSYNKIYLHLHPVPSIIHDLYFIFFY